MPSNNGSTEWQLLTCTQQLKILKLKMSLWKKKLNLFSLSLQTRIKCTWFNVEIGFFVCHIDSLHCVVDKTIFKWFFFLLTHSASDCLYAKWNVYECIFVWHKWKINQIRYPIVKTLQAIRFIESCTIFFFSFSLFSVPNSIFLIGKKTTIFEIRLQTNYYIVSIILQSREEFHIALSCHQPSSQMHFFNAYKQKKKKKKMGSEHFKRATHYNKTITTKERVLK